MTTQERTEKLPPLERFNLLAAEIDRLRERLDIVNTDRSIDDSLELIELDDLRIKFQSSIPSIRAKLSSAGGCVFKLGKKYVIRKISYLRALEHLEG